MQTNYSSYHVRWVETSLNSGVKCIYGITWSLNHLKHKLKISKRREQISSWRVSVWNQAGNVFASGQPWLQCLTPPEWNDFIWDECLVFSHYQSWAKAAKPIKKATPHSKEPILNLLPQLKLQFSLSDIPHMWVKLRLTVEKKNLWPLYMNWLYYFHTNKIHILHKVKYVIIYDPVCLAFEFPFLESTIHFLLLCFVSVNITFVIIYHFNDIL